MYQTDPSGNFFDYKAIAIGARSQSAKTYLEKNFQSFDSASLEDLIKHALTALKDTTGENVELNSKNCSIGIVGIDRKFTIYDEEAVEEYLKMLEADKDKMETN